MSPIFFFFKIHLLIWESEWASTQPNAGINPVTLRLRPELKPRVGQLNDCHPGTPPWVLFLKPHLLLFQFSVFHEVPLTTQKSKFICFGVRVYFLCILGYFLEFYTYTLIWNIEASLWLCWTHSLLIFQNSIPYDCILGSFSLNKK